MLLFRVAQPAAGQSKSSSYAEQTRPVRPRARLIYTSAGRNRSDQLIDKGRLAFLRLSER